MKETGKIELFVKAFNTLKRKLMVDASIPQGVVEVRINPEDAAALNKMKNLTEKIMNHASSLMVSDVHTHYFGKEATDRVISNAEGSRSSWIRRFF